MAQLLYLDCTAGISGDMCAAALIDAGADEAAVLRALKSLPIEGFSVEITQVVKSGLVVRDFNVVLDAAHENHDHDMAYLHGGSAEAGGLSGRAHRGDCASGDGGECHHGGRVPAGHSHQHRSLADITSVIDAAAMTPSAKELAHAIFGYVARAEARAHGVPVEQVHFHEVGAVDSIADIVAIAVAADSLDIDGVVVGDLPCGHGFIRCQHGLIPVPAPATVLIAEEAGLAFKPVDIEGELVTPTGAAVAAALRTQGHLPERFAIRAVGMGAGKRAYDTPGILRALVVEPLDGCQ